MNVFRHWKGLTKGLEVSLQAFTRCCRGAAMTVAYLRRASLLYVLSSVCKATPADVGDYRVAALGLSYEPAIGTPIVLQLYQRISLNLIDGMKDLEG